LSVGSNGFVNGAAKRPTVFANRSGNASGPEEQAKREQRI